MAASANTSASATRCAPGAAIQIPVEGEDTMPLRIRFMYFAAFVTTVALLTAHALV
jgi:hypothetical protein